tara:strand:+ start:1161 stop:1343 length:183 start_codon:yes stop_codon:yes gene_type:complete
MKHKSMSQMNKERGKKWDGKTRPTTELYRKRWNEIFGNTPDDNDRSSRDDVSEKPKPDVQ